MATTAYLAMTAAEIAQNPVLPPKIGWMACHFSPFERGLSNLPAALPEGSLLILDDSIPFCDHDSDLIATQLKDCMAKFRSSGLFLDFQRPGHEDTAALIRHLLLVLSFPVAVSECYAGNLTCPVCLAPVPPSVPLEACIAKWSGREIWLETGLDGEQITLAKQGCSTTLLPRYGCPEEGHRDAGLHCHYRIETGEDVRFTLWRTREDLQMLMNEAQMLGITTTVGLWQELHT